MVLKDKVIMILGNTRYDGPIQATSLFIAQNLSRENKVFFIDYPVTLKDYFFSFFINRKSAKERRKKYSFFSDGLIPTELTNLKIIITPPVLPINFLPEGFIYRKILQFNELIIRNRLKKIIASEKIREFIFINSFNFHYPDLVKGLAPRLSIYHCVDPMIVPYDKKHGILSEEILVRESNLVICTSKALFREKSVQNSNTYFVPNATDSNLLKIVKDHTLALHSRLSAIPKPIIGYIGTIERRIDYDLLLRVVQDNPGFSFVLAGPVTPEFLPASLSAQPNMHIVGVIPYDEVPQLIKSFDVAIIPFKKDKVSNTIFPIKLFEYLGAGKPVVVTDFNDDLRDFTADQVCYCSDPVSFSSALQQALLSNNPDLIRKREQLAEKNTWEKRTEQIAEIISRHLSGQNGKE